MRRPRELVRDGHSRILGLTDFLQSIAIKGVCAREWMSASVDPHDFALAGVEGHSPFLTPLFQMVQVSLGVSWSSTDLMSHL